MDNINMFIDVEVIPVAPRLAVFSGHDTTITPLLASLGPKLWNDTFRPPYASMFIIEVSQSSSNKEYSSSIVRKLLGNHRLSLVGWMDSLID
jgi:hypothetical protein